jgi:thiol-disulfide isomerase/thioredoxin
MGQTRMQTLGRTALWLVLAGGCWGAIYLVSRRSTGAEDKPVHTLRLEGKLPAPELPADKQWLNTDRPIRIAQLKGKVVLLDFWTYCCINCMHVLPDLKRLERKYARELVVIGVHSAKFPGERNTENIRQAVLRHGIEHPVVNDADMAIWRLYGARAWPTLMLIDPADQLIARAAPGRAEITIDLAAYYCRQTAEPLCYYHDTRLKLPVIVQAGAAGKQLTVRAGVSGTGGPGTGR